MKSLISILALLPLALVSASAAPFADDAQVKATLVDLEMKSWVAWKARDGKYFDSFLSDDHVEVGVGGPAGKAPIVKFVGSPACVVTSYSVGEMQFSRITEDTAMLVYLATQDTTCGGQKVPSPTWATSVFVRRDGKWQNFLYQHTTALQAKSG